MLDALEQSPYADNTIVILWADHGYHLGEKNRFVKHSLWERANKVPLILAGPDDANQQCTVGQTFTAQCERLFLKPKKEINFVGVLVCI